MENKNNLGLWKINFILIAAAFAVIVIGFLLMTGSSTEVEFNPDIFSTRRIVIGPMTALLGFVLMIFAILYKPKTKETK
ncbi:MAG: DUF3098 domain-containing protein [Paludibacter sp.]|jgi:ABC-type multidrug transport system permease subunit|nr:DUF3098 domain-containing protein [Paludibacter sp.]